MRLTDLDPQWLTKNGYRVGFTFRCPTNPQWRQSCFVAPTPHREQDAIFHAAFGEGYAIQGCNPASGWTVEGGIVGASFETITVKPSLDGSAGGLWHGFITKGEIVGGL